MPIDFRCRCGRRIQAADRLAGQPGKCPACGHVFMIPRPAVEAAAEADEAYDLEGVGTYSLEARQDEFAAWSPEAAVAPVTAEDVASQPSTSSTAAGAPAVVKVAGPRKRRKKKAEGATAPPRPPLPPPKTLWEAWRRSFRMPLEGEGYWTLLTWTLIYGLTHGIVRIAPVVLLVSGMAPVAFFLLAVLLPAMILFVGYLLCYLLQVLRSAAHGDSELPSTNAGDAMVADLFKWLVCGAIGFGLLATYVVQGWWTGTPLKPAGLAVCLAFGIFYTPMALVACALHDSVLAANPLTVLAAIARTPLRYLATCGLIGLLACGGLLFVWLVPYVPLLTPLVGWGIAMYAALAVMHALGSMYYLSRERIGWFRLGLDEPLEVAAKS